MNILIIIAAILIATETINPGIDEGEEIQKKEVVVETIETKPSEEIISETQAAAEAEAKAAAEAQAAAEKEINYLKIALYIILLLAVLSGALLYFRKRDKSQLESKIVQPERKEQEQPIQEEIQPENKEEQPIDNANKEPTNFEETNEDEKK